MNFQENDETILRPFNYYHENKKSHFSFKFLDALNYWFKLPEDNIQMLHELQNLFGLSTILIDDIQDNSSMRGGIPVANNVFGIGSTTHCAKYLLFKAMNSILDKYPDAVLPETINLLVKNSIRIFTGQGVEIYHRDWYQCPTEQEYFEMAKQKTGTIGKLFIDLAQKLTGDSRDLTNLADLVGVFYQVRDDYSSLTSTEYEKSKDFAEDLTEGKYSFPIVHALNNNPDDQVVSTILKQRTDDKELKLCVINALKEYGSLDYTLKVMDEYLVKIKNEIARHGGNPPLVELIESPWETEKLFSD